MKPTISSSLQERTQQVIVVTEVRGGTLRDDCLNSARSRLVQVLLLPLFKSLPVLLPPLSLRLHRSPLLSHLHDRTLRINTHTKPTTSVALHNPAPPPLLLTQCLDPPLTTRSCLPPNRWTEVDRTVQIFTLDSNLSLQPVHPLLPLSMVTRPRKATSLLSHPRVQTDRGVGELMIGECLARREVQVMKM